MEWIRHWLERRRSPPWWARQLAEDINLLAAATSRLAAACRTQGEKLMALIDDVQAALDSTLVEVTKQTTDIASINSLMDGMRAQIAELLAQGGVSQALADKVLSVLDVAKKNSADIAEALAENVPPTP